MHKSPLLNFPSSPLGFWDIICCWFSSCLQTSFSISFTSPLFPLFVKLSRILTLVFFSYSSICYLMVFHIPLNIPMIPSIFSAKIFSETLDLISPFLVLSLSGCSTHFKLNISKLELVLIFTLFPEWLLISVFLLSVNGNASHPVTTILSQLLRPLDSSLHLFLLPCQNLHLFLLPCQKSDFLHFCLGC